jgi:hypothetical protein
VRGGGARVGDGDRACAAVHLITANPPNPTHDEPGFFMPQITGAFRNFILFHHELFLCFIFFAFTGSVFV